MATRIFFLMVIAISINVVGNLISESFASGFISGTIYMGVASLYPILKSKLTKQ